MWFSLFWSSDVCISSRFISSFVPRSYRLLWSFSKLCFLYSLNSFIVDCLFLALFSFTIHLFTSSFGCRAFGIVDSFILCTPGHWVRLFSVSRKVWKPTKWNLPRYLSLQCSPIEFFLMSIFLFFWDIYFFAYFLLHLFVFQRITFVKLRYCNLLCRGAPSRI